MRINSSRESFLFCVPTRIKNLPFAEYGFIVPENVNLIKRFPLSSPIMSSDGTISESISRNSVFDNSFIVESVTGCPNASPLSLAPN